MMRPVDGFRVSVDLQDFYSDERARCWVWVRDRDHAKRLRWLAAKLRRRWALQEPAALAVDGRLLHPRDPLALLQPDDTLRVIPLTKIWFEELNNQTHSTDEECNDDIVKASPNGPFPSPDKHNPVPQPPPAADQDELQRGKYRALQLLEACAGNVEEQERTAGGDVEGGEGAAELSAVPQKSRRRRVRRRRRSVPRSCSSPPPPSPPLTPTPAVLRSAPAPAVRPARLVHALVPPAPPVPPAQTNCGISA